MAKNIGFCSGVKRAVLIAEKALKEDKKPIQFLGGLVHNEKVIEKFRKKGVKFIKTLKEAKPGTLIIQAHGIAPFSKKINKNIVIRDATCPLVKKAQLIARSLYQQGFQVIIIGDKKHSETKGIKGYTDNTALIVENEKIAAKLPNFKKIGVISQTTQDLKNVEKVLNVLQKKAKEIKFINTLCPETQNRQKKLNLLLKKTDAILVIGSKKSANTGRLVKISENAGKAAWSINSLSELKKINLKNISNLGVISGTSAPNWLIKKIVDKIR